MQDEGLWRFPLSDDNPARRLADMFAGDEGQRPMGVQIAFARAPQTKSAYVNKLSYSLDAGTSWQLMSDPSQPLSLPLTRDALLQFNLQDNFVGDIQLDVTPFAVNLDGSKQLAAVAQPINIRITSVNDAPHPTDPTATLPPNPSLFPMVPFDLSVSKNEGFFAKDLAEIFYTDDSSSDSSLGLAVIFAQKSELGRWQFQLEGSTWSDLSTSSTSDFLPSGLLLESTYRGPIQISQYMVQLACQSESSPTTNDGRCWKLVRDENCPTKETNQTTAKNRRRTRRQDQYHPEDGENGFRNRRRQRRQAGATALSFALQDFAQATEQTAASATTPSKPANMRRKMQTQQLPSNTVPLILLGPLAMLRFQPNQENVSWSVLEAIQSTRLLFTAWDGSDGSKSGDIANVSMPFCCSEGMCGSKGSLARDFTTFYIQKADCDGTPVTQYSSKLDTCGVCGGLNNCYDCSGKINGTYVFECDQCVAKAGTAKNCAGLCGDSYQMVTKSGSESCLAKSRVAATVGCDGVVNSTAVINRCGQCTGGNTSLNASAGIDRCGSCVPLGMERKYAAAAADNCPCFQQRDLCDVCRTTDDKDWNQCPDANKVIQMSVDTYDRLSGTPLELDLAKSGFRKELYTNATCKLTPKNGTSGQTISATSVTVVPGALRATFSSGLPVGQYSVDCQVKLNGSSLVAQRTGTGDLLTVVDSANITIMEVIASPLVANGGSGGGYQITVTVERDLEDYEERRLACFCRVTGQPVSLPMTETMVKDDNRKLVYCGKLPFPGGNEYECGILFNPDATSLRIPGLPVGKVVIRLSSPQLVRGTLSKNDTVTIRFDKNIEGPSNCSSIFDNTTMRILRDSKCNVNNNKLKILLGQNSTITETSKLSFRSDNGIRAEGSQAGFADSFVPNQSVSLVMDGRAENAMQATVAIPSFEISSYRQLCFGSRLQLRVADMRNFGNKGDLLQWNITSLLQPGTRDGKKDQMSIMLNGTFEIGSSSNATFYSAADYDDVSSKGSKRSGRSDNGIVIVIPTTQLSTGIEYGVETVGIVPSNGSRSQVVFTKFVLAAENQSMVVNIKPPSMSQQVFADRPLSLDSRLKMCSSVKGRKESLQQQQNSGDARYRYYWSTNGSISMDLSAKDSPSLTLDRGTMVAGGIYRFDLVVVPEQNPEQAINASVEIRIAEKGVAAKVSTTKLTVGSDTAIRLDGSLSEDKDNKPGDLQFDWVCTSEDTGELCYVAGDGNKTLLKDRFDDQMRKSRALIPGNSLSPGRYKFTLCVSKEKASSCQNVSVTVKAGKVPTFQLAARDTKVDPTKELVVKALVDGSADTCVHWECDYMDGFSYVNLADYSRSADIACFNSRSDQRGFHLVLPPNVLQPESSYHFRIVGRNDVFGTSEASIVIETMSVPQPGKCEVSPSTGIAMNTSFDISCRDFSPSHDDLTYSFYYSDKSAETDNSSFYLTETTAVGAATVTVQLPIGKIKLTTKICNAYQVCVQIDVAGQGVVTSLGDIGGNVVRDLGVAAAQLLFQKSYLEAVSLLKRTTSTLVASTAVWQQYRIPLCSLDFRIFSEVSTAVAQQMLPSDVDEVVEIMRAFVKSECLSFSVSGSSDGEMLLKKDRQDAMTSIQLLRKKMTDVVTSNSVTSDSSQASSSGRQKRDLGSVSSRRKRQSGVNANIWDNPILSFATQTLDPDQMGMILQLSEIGLDVDGGGSNGTATEEQIQMMTDYINQIHDDVMKGLCQRTTSQSDPKLVASGLSSVSLERTEFQPGSNTTFQFGNNRSTVVLGDSLSQMFSQWNCQNDTSTSCVGLGIGMAVINRDVVTPTSQKFNATMGSMVSAIHDVRLMNPLSCADMTVALQGKRLQEPLHLSIGVGELPPPQQQQQPSAGNVSSSNSGRRKRAVASAAGTQLQFTCMVFIEDTGDWNASVCQMKGFTIMADGTANVNCDCSVSGHTAVFLVQSNGSLTEIPEVYTMQKKIQFIISEDYNRVSGSATFKSAFLKSLKKQLANLVGANIYNIVNLDANPGSVIVNYTLVAFNDTDKTFLEKTYLQMAQLFMAGKVILLDVNGTTMQVPPQCIDNSIANCDKPTEEEKKFTIIIVAIAAAVVLVIIIIIIVAIWKKQKKSEKKIMPVMGGSHSTTSHPPTYRSFAFAESLEGSNIEKYRSKQSRHVPAYMPDDHNYKSIRKQSRASVILLEEDEESDSESHHSERRRNRRNRSDDGTPVPRRPAKYDKPSKRDMEMTQPIPDDIVSGSGNNGRRHRKGSRE